MFDLSISGSFSMFFKHFCNSFNLENPTNDFIQLHQLCSHVAISHTPKSMVQVSGASWPLVLAKMFSGIHPIVMGEAIY